MLLNRAVATKRNHAEPGEIMCNARAQGNMRESVLLALTAKMRDMIKKKLCVNVTQSARLRHNSLDMRLV